MLLPFGTVNLAWPDWEEDLRRCDEQYKMPGIRIYPIYQTFGLDHPDFPKLVQKVAERGMILQIVGDVEDIRQIHPIVHLRGVNFEPLIEIMKKTPAAKVQLLYWNNRIGRNLEKLVSETNVVLDISRIEGNGVGSIFTSLLSLIRSGYEVCRKAFRTFKCDDLRASLRLSMQYAQGHQLCCA